MEIDRNGCKNKFDISDSSSMIEFISFDRSQYRKNLFKMKA